MKLKPNLQVRKIATKYMVVDTDAAQVNMVNVYTMNETAATLWKEFTGKEFMPNDMVEILCSEYEVSREQATHDVDAMLREWNALGLLLEYK